MVLGVNMEVVREDRETPAKELVKSSLP